MTSWGLPQTVSIGGLDYAVHADYRDVLDIIAHLGDQTLDEQTRMYVALALFYEDFASMDDCDYAEAAEQMFLFVNCGEKETDCRQSPKTIDWEQDKNLIVADVNRVAGCEIRSLPFCHWWTFIAWFNGVGEGQLSAVVSIRNKVRQNKKLDDWEQAFYREHRERVDFKQFYSEEELAEQERLKKLLGE